MDDATLRRVLAFAHPVWMVLSLGLAILTAQLGLQIRRRRGRGLPIGPELRARHMRFGRRALVFVAIGFVAGPLSMALFRDRPVFDSFHGVLGLIVAGLFAWTGWTGRALSRGDREARDLHRIAAAGALGAALLSAVAGFVLLP